VPGDKGYWLLEGEKIVIMAKEVM